MWRYLLGLAGCIPILVLLAAAMYKRWEAKKSGARLPFTESMLRPPGYSLGQKVEGTGEDFLMCSFWGLLCGLLAAGAFRMPESDGGQILTQAVFAVGAAVCTVFAWRKLQDWRRLKLGLLGEQVMGEHLNKLVEGGYSIFHDVPGDGKWNIDHVAVGPGGVFAVETKARMKKPGQKGEPAHRASFDGKIIRFPWGWDREALDQASRNGKWLAEVLSKSTGERVEVQGIVALPGWMVEVTTPESAVKVLSGKQVAGFIRNADGQLSEKRVQQIVYQLEQRCRDVGM